MGMYAVGSLFSFVIAFRFFIFHEKEDFFNATVGSFLMAAFWIVVWPIIGIVKFWDMWLGPLVRHLKTFKSPKWTDSTE